MTFRDQRLAAWPLAVAAAAILMAAPAQAVNYNEGTSGDLSSDASNPTNIGALSLGTNNISGATDPSGTVVDPMTGALSIQDNDYVTFSVPSGYTLSKLLIGANSSFVGDDRMFFGIASGTGVSVDPSFTSAAGLLGWTLVGTSTIGSDALPLLGASAPDNFPAIPGATGFNGSLGAGTYTLWMLDGDHDASYDLNLVVAPVPETSTWVMLMAGLGLLGAALRLRAPRRVGAAV
jgi:hypothetical protein